MTNLILPILGGVIVLWTSLRWYWFRIFDGTDESLGVLALLTAAAFIARSKLEDADRLPGKTADSNWIFPTLLTLIYTALLPLAAKPVLGILMVFIIGAIANSSGALAKDKMVTTLAMLLLALPLTSAFNFYFQWPLQVFIAQGTAAIFWLYGILLEVKGASIFLDGKPIVIDAACSGVHFIWFSIYLGVLVAYLRKATALRTIFTIAISLNAALIANLARVVILTFCFVLELPDLANNLIFHQAVGIVVFLLLCCFIFLSFDIKIKIPFAQLKAKSGEANFSLISSSNRFSNSQPLNKMQISQCSFLVICLISILVTATAGHNSFAYYKERELWPSQFEGRQLISVPLSAHEKAFEENFPGHIAKFSDGLGEVIFRKVYTPTRQLHPISECLRAAGFTIEQESAIKDKTGISWNRAKALIGNQRLNVEERITDSTGGTWPTISQWYWAAMLGQTKGPWLSITTARTAKLASQQIR